METPELSFANKSWIGNPFDLMLTGHLTSPSGKELTQIGFYAGNNTRKIYFIPDEIASWTYQTESSTGIYPEKPVPFVA